MAIELTPAALRESEKVNIGPQLVLEIEGLDTLFGAVTILQYIRIGDPGLYIGNDWVIGGYNEIDDQLEYISLNGTSNTIQQQLRPDLGSVSSISSVAVQLIDKDNFVSGVISPGVLLSDILGRRATLWFGFAKTAWKEDFIKIFAGRIDDVVSGAGNVTINIAHPDNLKRQDILIKKDSTITAPMTTGFSTVPVLNAADFFDVPYEDTPSGVRDESLRYFAKIDDEVIEYETITGDDLTDITRGALGTTNANHDANAKVETFYVLEGTIIDLALKVMLSGVNGYFAEDVPVNAFNVVTPAQVVPNAIFFQNFNVSEELGIVAGDYITTTGALNPENNVDLVTISAIVVINEGSFIVVNDVAFVDETDSTATISFRSQYDTLGVGLGMTPLEVDVEEHHYWRDLYLNNFEYSFYIKDKINGKEFIEKELYVPFGAYSIPRKTKASMGYHLGPVPRNEIPIFSVENIKKPGNVKLRRTTSKNFYNTIVYRFDEQVLDEKFESGRLRTDADSKNRIPVGNKVFTIDAKGVRTDLDAIERIDFASERLLSRYKFAAEFFEGVEVFFKSAFNAEPGDLVVLNFDGLQITNSSDGTRDKEERFYEIINRTLDLKTGNIKLELIDTNFGKDERYGIISPSSMIESATTTYAYIQDSFGILYPFDEPRKWKDYVGLPILIHSEDFSYSETTVFTGFDPSDRYKMLFGTTLSMAPSPGYVIDIVPYSDSPMKRTNSKYKLFHPHLSPLVEIVTGISNNQFTVGLGDVDKFQVGFPIRVHNADFTDYSPELKVTDITGTTITVSDSMGFIPNSTYVAEFLGFPDGGFCYRYI